MSNELVTKEQNHPAYIDKVLHLIPGQADMSKADLENFALQCKRTGLDPITRQIYAIPNKDKLTIMASIDGLRLIAERSGAYEGQTAPQWCDENGAWTDVWLKKVPPSACKIGVYKTKFREPLIAIALFDEYAGRYAYDDKYGKYKKGDLTHMWNKMPALMIAKVAEALALRKAFPNEMSGIYSSEEMEQAQIQPAKDVTQIQDVKKAPDVAARLITDKIDFESYIIQFGKKMSGKKLTDFHVDDHIGMLTWLDDQVKKSGKPLSDKAKEYYEIANAYVTSLIGTPPPKVDNDEVLPF